MERFANFPSSSPARPDEIDNSSTTNSPTSNSNNCYNGASSLLLLSRPVCRSESNPHPTTFVQADSATFKQVVQMLTGGSSSDPASKGHNSIPPIRTGQKKQGFKLYERRNSLKYGLTPLLPNLNKKNSEILSPSMLDFPSLALMSPVTPLTTGEKVYSPTSSPEEEKTIAHKEGFYLHPSPGRTSMSIPMNETPRLLSLFPVTSSSSSPKT